MSPTTAISELSDTADLSYREILALQKCQYLAGGKWRLHVHSSHGYIPSGGVNDDPGIVRMVSDLIRVSSSLVTRFKLKGTIMEKCGIYTTRTRCSTHLDNIWMAEKTIHQIVRTKVLQETYRTVI
jgi:hypothetical protein